MALVAGVASGGGSKPATSARIYDYYLGGTHNFPADRDAAKAMLLRFPLTPGLARTNRAFLRRSVRYLGEAGVTQFLDIGSGIPTEGNVHEVIAEVVPAARVVYVDMDPVAVSESLDILEGNDRTTAIVGDLREPQNILTHPRVRDLIDFRKPVALLMNAVLHFVSDDTIAYNSVKRLVGALAPGSYLAMSHVCVDELDLEQYDLKFVQDMYEQQTTTPFCPRSRTQVMRFFEGLEFVEPGLVYLSLWRPAPGDPTDFIDNPSVSSCLAGVGRLP